MIVFEYETVFKCYICIISIFSDFQTSKEWEYCENLTI